MSTRFEDQPLRARKRARTRTALVEALLERLSERPLDDIGVKELAGAAGISEATFFNYFPTKEALLVHFIQLWTLKVGAMARRARAEEDRAYAALEAVLVTTGEMSTPAPNVMREVIAAQARAGDFDELEPIELAERLLFLPEEDDVMGLPDGGLGTVIPELVQDAIDHGELPACTDVMQLTLAIASVFFGVPLILGHRQPEAIVPMYRAQLRLIWSGARASEESS